MQIFAHLATKSEGYNVSVHPEAVVLVFYPQESLFLDPYENNIQVEQAHYFANPSEFQPEPLLWMPVLQYGENGTVLRSTNYHPWGLMKPAALGATQKALLPHLVAPNTAIAPKQTHRKKSLNKK